MTMTFQDAPGKVPSMPEHDTVWNEMMEHKEQLRSLAMQANSNKKKDGRFFKYASEMPTSMEVTFKDFLSLEPEMVKNAIIATKTSIDVNVHSPDWIDCIPLANEDNLECSIASDNGGRNVIGKVMGVSNFKNSRMIPGDDGFKVVPSGSSMRCVAEDGKILFCIGY